MVFSLTRAGAKQAARDTDLPFSQIGTIHSAAYRALGSPILAESKISEWNEAHPQFVLSGHNEGTDDSYGSQEAKTDADQAKLDVAWYRTHQVPVEHWTKLGAADFYAAWNDWKKQCGYLDFTDLIEIATRDCETAPGDPAVLLCDEAQDTGKLEMRLLMKWAEHAEHLVLFGDSAQAIFSWRGSDALLLQRLWMEFDARRPHLNRTYRLSRQVYAYAYNWAKDQFKQTRALEFTPRDVEGSFRLLNQSFARFQTAALESLIEEYTQDDKTLMFQATCAYMLDPLISMLREIGVPFHSPGRVTNGKWNPLPQRRSKGHTVVDRVLAFMRPDADVWGEQARFWTTEDIQVWSEGLPVQGILRQAKRKEIDGFSRKATDETIAEMMPSWFMEEALQHIAPKPDLAWYIGHLTKGSDNLRKYVMEVINRHGVGALRKRPQVEVGTVHALKGREADTVVLAPDMSLMAYQAARKSEESAEEMKRVYYVGVTRARDNLLLAAPSGKTFVRW